MKAMVELKDVIDTWNMLEKHNIQNFYATSNNSVIISKDDYNKMIEEAKNKQYIKNLLKK